MALVAGWRTAVGALAVVRPVVGVVAGAVTVVVVVLDVVLLVVDPILQVIRAERQMWDMLHDRSRWFRLGVTCSMQTSRLVKYRVFCGCLDGDFSRPWPTFQHLLVREPPSYLKWLVMCGGK